MAMRLSAQEHRLVADLIRQKAAKAPEQDRQQLERLAANHEGMARYLDKNPYRGPVPAVEAPSIAP
jgi:hypothetical protein